MLVWKEALQILVMGQGSSSINERLWKMPILAERPKLTFNKTWLHILGFSKIALWLFSITLVSDLFVYEMGCAQTFWGPVCADTRVSQIVPKFCLGPHHVIVAAFIHKKTISKEIRSFEAFPLRGYERNFRKEIQKNYTKGNLPSH